MAKVGALRAAELTGKSKSTIQRAMKSGKLSYHTDMNGYRVIDVSELERVYGLEKQQKPAKAVEVELEKASSLLETERLKMRVKMLENQLEMASEQIADLKDQRDQWQKQASQVLITSQYSQKQAEELRQELEERKRKIRQRRQELLAKKMKTIRAENENKNDKISGYSFSFTDLWKKSKASA